MSRYFITIFCLLFAVTTIFGQTLFTYGGDSVTVATFLKAYHKNNSTTESAKTLKEYLDLYIASRLKIKEAKERGYDTLQQLVTDLQSLREQIMPSYLNDAESVNKLVNEAFIRSQKDIHLAHIFISFINKKGQFDSISAKQRATEVYSKLNNNANFFDIARKYSDDTTAKINGGDVGYITVFTLPYEIENIVYNIPVNKIAPIYKSKAGYYIFKNLGERKAIGKVKAAQILLAFPPEADAATKNRLRKLADSLYNRLQKGADFGKLAKEYSNDFISASSDGLMPEFGVGQYDPFFEKTVFALKNGIISKPFATAFGYHIVKRIASVPVSDKKDKNTMQALQDKVEQSDRINLTKTVQVQKVLKEANFKRETYHNEELWAFTDSVIDGNPSTIPLHFTADSPLFSIGNKKVTVNDWIQYAQNYRYKQDGSDVEPYNKVWDEFVQTTALDYYKDHLETFNPAFHNQVNEFKEGNLFFEIMQRMVWGPAQADTAALEKYYRQHASKYQWNQSADAVIFYANNEASAKQLMNALKKNLSRWKSEVADRSDKIAADSGRFELTQIPGAVPSTLKAEILTAPVLNKADSTASFAYILKMYPQPAQRTFAEAKSQVINDYQNELEEKWVQELKQKYQVKINEKALANLLAGK